MRNNNLLYPALLATSAYLICGMAYGQTSRIPDSASDAHYDCPIPDSGEVLRQKALGLATATYDRNKLGCAADLWGVLARQAEASPEVQIQALGVITRYLSEVNTLWDLDLYGIHAPEWSARLQHATPLGKAIEARLEKLAPDLPASLASRALFDLAWTAKQADTAAALKVSGDAVRQLKLATSREKAVQGGNAMLALAKLEYELPEFSGGDPARGVDTITEAFQLAAGNPGVIRYFAYVQTQENHPDVAARALKTLLPLPTTQGDLQQMADELLAGRDLAQRLQDKSLQKLLADKRDTLLAAHHELLTRAHTAANLHGGVDPITGKEY